MGLYKAPLLVYLPFVFNDDEKRRKYREFFRNYVFLPFSAVSNLYPVNHRLFSLPALVNM